MTATLRHLWKTLRCIVAIYWGLFLIAASLPIMAYGLCFELSRHQQRAKKFGGLTHEDL
jgi:hypothetical protein